MRLFTCHEDPGHVEEVDITSGDLQSVADFLKHFNVPHEFTEQFYSAMRPASTPAERHNAAHQLLEYLLIAADAGHPELNDPMYKLIIPALREKQKLCSANKDGE